MGERPKKLLDRARDALRVKQTSLRTGQADVNWIRRYILFHDKRHPSLFPPPRLAPHPPLTIIDTA